jgi:hypothetical protein
MEDLDQTRELLKERLTRAITDDPIAALPVIATIHQDSGELLKDAVRAASGTASWSQIGDALGVSKQAAHQRFKDLATGLAGEIKEEHRAMKQARRRGDGAGAAAAKARRDELAAELRREATQLQRKRY